MVLISDNLMQSSLALAPAARGGVDADIVAELNVSTIRTMEELHRFLPEWRAFLAGRVQGARLVNDPANIDFVLKHGKDFPLIVVIRRNGRLQCIAPFFIHRTHFTLQWSVFKLVSLSLRMMRPFGKEFVCSSEESPSAYYPLIFDALYAAVKEFDLISLPMLDTGSDLWKYWMAADSGRRRFRPIVTTPYLNKYYHLPLPGSWEEYLATLGSSTRSNLKRRARKLLDGKGDDSRFIKITKAEQVRTFLRDVDEVYRDTWQAKTNGPRQWSDEGMIARLEHMAEKGWLRSYLLIHEGRPIAFQEGYHHGSTYHACEFGYSQAMASAGPGGVLMFLMLEDLFRENKPEVIDLGLGNSPHKQSFRGVSKDVADMYLAPPNRWRYIIALQRSLNAAEQHIRSLVTKLRLDKAIRRILHHKG